MIRGWSETLPCSAGIRYPRTVLNSDLGDLIRASCILSPFHSGGRIGLIGSVGPGIRREENNIVASRKSIWVGRVISILLSLMFLFSAILKFVGGPQLAEGFNHLGLPMRMALPLAILELLCVVIYLIPPTAVLGAILLTGYIGGAICTHWRVGDPFYVQILLGILVWVGLYLREDYLRALIPLRRSATP